MCSGAIEVMPRFKASVTRKKRRNLAPWRRAVLHRDGQRCRICGLTGAYRLSAHHLVFLSHCETRYETDPRNGLTLCNELGNGCHQAVHAGRKKIAYGVLPPSVVQCLAEQGLVWVRVNDGQTERLVPTGTLARYFS